MACGVRALRGEHERHGVLAIADDRAGASGREGGRPSAREEESNRHLVGHEGAAVDEPGEGATVLVVAVAHDLAVALVSGPALVGAVADLSNDLGYGDRDFGERIVGHLPIISHRVRRRPTGGHRRLTARIRGALRGDLNMVEVAAVPRARPVGALPERYGIGDC